MNVANLTLGQRANAVKAGISLVSEVSAAVHLKPDGPRKLVGCCPFHGEKTASFFVYTDSQRYHCYGCGADGDLIEWRMLRERLTFPQAVERLESLIGQPGRQPAPPPRPATRAVPKMSDMFRTIWNQGVDPAGTPVETYLGSRGGLKIPEGAPIRFHPRCQRGPRNLPGGPEHLPAMLALMTDPVTGQPVGLHRTYLRPDGSGKAPTITRGDVTLKPKMILGSWGIVRLYPCEGRAVAISEGIENALTAAQRLNWGPAVWAAGTQDCIRKFPVLNGLESLAVFADADDAGVGVEAANACADRWSKAGREISIYIPPAGLDWNDVVGGRAA